MILLLFFSSSWWHFCSAAVLELVALIAGPPPLSPISASCAEEISQQPVGGDQAPSITAKKPNPMRLRRLAGQSLKGFFTKPNLRSLSAHVCANGIITALTLSRAQCVEITTDSSWRRKRWLSSKVVGLGCNYFIVVHCQVHRYSAFCERRNSYPDVKPSQNQLTC